MYPNTAELRFGAAIDFSHLPAARTSTSKGTGVARLPNGAPVVNCLLILGLWTDGAHVFKLQHSDNDVDGEYADVVDGTDVIYNTAQPTLTAGTYTVSDATNDNLVVAATYKGLKKWLRWVVTVTGSPSTGLVAASAFVQAKSDAGNTPSASSAAF